MIENGRDEATCEGFAFASLYELVEVAFHGLEYEIELLCGRKEEKVVEGYYIRVIRYSSQRLGEWVR